MDDVTPNYWNYQTNYIKTSYKKIVDLFCIIFTLRLDQDISKVCAKFSACFHHTVWRISNGKSGTVSDKRHFWSCPLHCWPLVFRYSLATIKILLCRPQMSRTVVNLFYFNKEHTFSHFTTSQRTKLSIQYTVGDRSSHYFAYLFISRIGLKYFILWLVTPEVCRSPCWVSSLELRHPVML